MTYESLNAEFRLRVLKTEEDYEAAKAFWAKYMADAIADDSTSETVIEYSEVLSLLMDDYEKRLLDESADEEDDRYCTDCDSERCVCEDEPNHPEESDWVTDDYTTFREHGCQGIIHVPPGQPWQVAVRERMFQEHFWPNVWYYNDLNEYERLTLEMEEEE